MSKVLKVINGYKSKYDIEEITFFENDDCLYSDSLEKFLSTSANDTLLFDEKNRILNSECEKVIKLNFSKLFIFINSSRHTKINIKEGNKNARN